MSDEASRVASARVQSDEASRVASARVQKMESLLQSIFTAGSRCRAEIVKAATVDSNSHHHPLGLS